MSNFKVGQIVYGWTIYVDFVSFDVLKVVRNLTLGRVIVTRLCTNYRHGQPHHLWEDDYQEERFEHCLFSSISTMAREFKKKTNTSLKICIERADYISKANDEQGE